MRSVCVSASVVVNMAAPIDLELKKVTMTHSGVTRANPGQHSPTRANPGYVFPAGPHNSWLIIRSSVRNTAANTGANC